MTNETQKFDAITNNTSKTVVVPWCFNWLDFQKCKFKCAF